MIPTKIDELPKGTEALVAHHLLLGKISALETR